MSQGVLSDDRSEALGSAGAPAPAPLVPTALGDHGSS